MDDLDAEFVEMIADVGSVRAGHIAAAGDELATQIRSEADALGASSITEANRGAAPVLSSLPRQTYSESLLWRYQFAEAAAALAADARRWGAPVPRCTGEEMALHLILHRAAAAAGCPRSKVFEWPDDDLSRPDRGPGWGDLFEYLFQDHDVLLLHEMPAEETEALRGVNLHPRRWFTEFSAPFEIPPRTAVPAPTR